MSVNVIDIEPEPLGNQGFLIRFLSSVLELALFLRIQMPRYEFFILKKRTRASKVVFPFFDWLAKLPFIYELL